jgi:branched-chain amino acid transport system permease protein
MIEAIVPTAPWGASHAWIGIQWTDAVAFVVLVLVLMFRPTGLLGERLGRSA